jgi:DNA invertase Pin-like site-specific DNA recombinase
VKPTVRKATAEQTLHIYTRVSTAAQRDDGTSLQTQLEQGTARAKQLGLKTRHWDEGGKSSHHEDLAARPTLAALYEAIKDGEVKHLFVYDQSRLSRNDNVASIFRYECNKQGVTLYTKDGHLDLSNPQDKFLKQILDGLSEFDNAIRAERTRLGKLNRARSGGWHGGPPPFGYKLVNCRLVIEPNESKWVKRMFSEAFEGQSPQKIKQLLDSNAVSPRRGGLWTIGSVAALLKNSHYIGNYAFNDRKSDELVTVTCPAIVDPDLWKAVQLKRKRQYSRAPQQNPTKHFYLLRDLMFCGHCGRPIAGRQRMTKREQFYYCANKEREWAKQGGSRNKWKRGTGCGMSRALNIPQTDELVFSAVLSTHDKSYLLKEQVKRRVLSADGASTAKSAKEVEALNLKVRRLEKRLEQARSLLGIAEGHRDLGKMSKAQFESRRKVIESEIELVETELNNLNLSIKGQQTHKKWDAWIKQFGEMIASKRTLRQEEKKQYIAGLLDRIEVRYLKAKDAHELKLQFRLPIVSDKFHRKGVGRKGDWYDLGEGTKDLLLRVDKKPHKKQGKASAPEQNQSVTVE